MGLDAASVVRWEHRPQLRQPIMIVSFEGWSDAGEASSMAARYLSESWPVRRFATIDPEEFFDFTTTRPQIRIEGGTTRRIEWPETLLLAGPIPGAGRDVIILRGVEPQLKWRGFCGSVLGVASTLGVQMVLTLGALLADVPHSRPVPVVGAAYESSLAERFGLEISRYEGESGIVGVFHDACLRAGLPSIGLWASVPHYVHQVTSPKAALALVERAAAILGTRLDPVELRAAGEVYVRQVDERVADDEDAAAYVAQLEEAADRLAAETPTPTSCCPVPIPWAPRRSDSSGTTIGTETAPPTPPGGAARALTSTCVWRTSPELLLALDHQFGEPFDTYVNGSQVWLRPDGPNGITIEWRLHPVAGYQRPAGVGTSEVFENAVFALSSGESPRVAPKQLWEGLEAFPAYGDDVEPAPLLAATSEALGLVPDAAGLVDHQPIGDAWERNRGGFSVINELFRQLQP